MIGGIKFVSVPVADQDRALRFWTETMGLKLTTDLPFDGKQRWIELQIPGAETGLVLFTAPGQEGRIGQFQPISFMAEDVIATAAEMKAKGVEFVAGPKEESWGTSAIFRDSEGNQYVLGSS